METGSKIKIRALLALLACFMAGLFASAHSAHAAPKTITLTATSTTLNAQLDGPGQHNGKIINFIAGGAVLGSATSNSSGLATIALSALPPGSYQVVAVQNGSEYSDSNSLGVIVPGAARTLSLSANPSPMTFGAGPATLSATPSAGGGAITYERVSGQCTLAGAIVTSTGAGECVVRASIAANGAYAAASSNAETILINRANRTITATANPYTISFGGSLTLGAQMSAGDGAVAYTITSGACSINGTSLTASEPGFCNFTAAVPQTQDYNAATSGNVHVTIEPAERTLTLTAMPNPTTTATPVLLSATPSAGGGVITYQYVSGPCTLSGASLTATSPGACVVNATIAADGNYANATAGFLSIVVNETSRTLNLAASPGAIAFGGSASTLTATPSAGAGAINYALLSGPCTLSGSTLTGDAAGACVVNATVAAAGGYAAATSGNVTVNVSRADRTLNLLASPSSIAFGAGAVTLLATPSAGDGAVSYAFVSGPCTLSGSTLTPTGAGTCIVNASVAQTQKYNAATSSNVPVVVSPASRTLSLFANPSPMTFGGGSATLSATPSAGGGSVTYQYVSGPCTLSGSTLTSTGAGTCIVNASIAADGGYGAATSTNLSVTVNAAGQAPLTLNASPSTIALNSTSALSTSGGSGTGAVTYAVTGGSCTINGNILTAAGAGSCTVTATKAGDGNYTQVVSSAITITVNPLAQTIFVQASTSAIIVAGNANLTIVGAQGTGARSFSVASGPCTIAGSTLTGSGVGACSVIGAVAADSNYLAVTSAPISVNVSQASSSVALTASASNIQYGASVTFTAVVSGASPTGAVTFRKGGANLATVALVGGQASYSTSALGTGANTLIAIYGGDTSNTPATSNAVSVNVSRPNPALDPDVRGIAIAQVGALRRFAETQIENVHRRLETLHEEGLQCVGADFCVTYNHGLSMAPDQTGQPVRALGYAADPRLEGRDAAFKAVDLSARSAPGAVSKYLYGGPVIAIWSAGAINIGKYENNGALIDNRFNTSGVTAGADMLIAPGFKAGIAMGYGRDRTDVGSWGSKSTAGGLAATAYGSYRVYGPLFLDALAGIGDARMKSRRVLPGEFENAVGQRNGLYWYGSAALTWEQKWERLSLAPYLRLDVIRGSLDSYVESGPQIAALSYDGASIRSTSGIFGLRGGYDIPMDWGVLAPMARLEYRRVIENDVNQALSYANEGGIVYPMLVNGVSRNLFQAGVGLRAKRASTATDAGVSGEIEYLFGTAGSEFTSHALRGAVKIAW